MIQPNKNFVLINTKQGCFLFMVLQYRSLDPKALSFISAITKTPKENFRCYTTIQLNQQHWNY